MRPDMEDYAEIEDDGKTGGSRAMSWMVLAVAVGGFAALAYYAYQSGTDAPTDNSELMTIEADQSPIKEAPVNPEGEQFPDKDKTIYDVISPNGSAQGGEKLMPDPEHPVAATNIEDSEDNLPSTVAAAPNVPAPATTTFVAPQDAPAAVPAPAPQAPVNVTEQPVVTTAKPVTTPKAPEPKSYSSPQMVNEKTLTGKKEPVKTEKPKAEKAAVSSGSGGSYQVQLGAFKSESEAQSAWKKISGKFSLAGSPSIIKADVNGATFYRLRTGSYASSAEAKAACAKMAGQACMPVK